MKEKVTPLVLDGKEYTKFEWGFQFIQLEEVYSILRKINPNGKFAQDILGIINDENWMMFKTQYQANRSAHAARKRHFAMKVAYLQYHGFSINQMMRYLGCSQSPIYRAMETIQDWLDNNAVPLYPAIPPLYKNHPALNGYVQHLVQVFNLLEYRKV